MDILTDIVRRLGTYGIHACVQKNEENEKESYLVFLFFFYFRFVLTDSSGIRRLELWAESPTTAMHHKAVFHLFPTNWDCEYAQKLSKHNNIDYKRTL